MYTTYSQMVQEKKLHKRIDKVGEKEQTSKQIEQKFNQWTQVKSTQCGLYNFVQLFCGFKMIPK